MAISILKSLFDIVGKVLGDFSKFFVSCLQNFVESIGLIVKTSDLFNNILSSIPDELRPILLSFIMLTFAVVVFKIVGSIRSLILG